MKGKTRLRVRHPGMFHIPVRWGGVDEGFLTARKAMRMYFDESGLYARIRDDRLYYIQEKESGYKELAVYSMIRN